MKKVWFSFKSLNEFFEIDSKQKGCYIDMDELRNNNEPIVPWNAGIKWNRPPLTEIHKKRIGDAQRGKKKPNSWKGRKHTPENIEKIRQKERGNTKRRRSIEVDGVVYPTVTGAMKALHIGFAELQKRGKYTDK